MRIAYIKVDVMRDIILTWITYMSKIPFNDLNRVNYALKYARKNPFVKFTISHVMLVMQLVFPSFTDGFIAFNGTSKNKSVSYHYYIPWIYNEVTLS